MNSTVFWFIFFSTTTQGISLADYPRILYDELIDAPVLTTELNVTTTQQSETTTEMPATTKESKKKPKWKPASDGRLPRGATRGGRDLDYSSLYVARARLFALSDKEIIPGKLKPSAGVIYISYAGTEIPKLKYEVLVGCKAKWVKTEGNKIPADAIKGGEGFEGPYYVCRAAKLKRITINGKMHFKNATCYILFAGIEYSFHEYEVLCCT